MPFRWSDLFKAAKERVDEWYHYQPQFTVVQPLRHALAENLVAHVVAFKLEGEKLIRSLEPKKLCHNGTSLTLAVHPQNVELFRHRGLLLFNEALVQTSDGQLCVLFTGMKKKGIIIEELGGET